MFKHEKGYSYSNKPSITYVIHFKDIQKVILRYITVTYPGIIIRVICSKKMCPVCMNFNCMPL